MQSLGVVSRSLLVQMGGISVPQVGSCDLHVAK